MTDKINRKTEFRNASINIAAIAIVFVIFFGLSSDHTKAGMIAQLLAYLLVATTASAGGAYSHRKIFPDIRPHLADSFTGKLLASAHRLAWIMIWMICGFWMLGNSGV